MAKDREDGGAAAGRDAPYRTFLPGMEEGYEPGLKARSGLVAADGAQPGRWLEDLARHMLTDGKDVGFAIPDVMAAEQQMRRVLRGGQGGAGAERIGVWRGTLALALLWDGWEQDGTWPLLEAARFDGETSAFAAAVSGARGGDSLTVLTLAREGEQGPLRRPLGLVSPVVVLSPAADPGNLSALLPDRVTWYDRVAGRFLDPCPYLNESDRTRLLAQLRLLEKLNEDSAGGSRLYDPDAMLVQPLEAFARDLGAVRDRGRDALEKREPDAVRALRIRLTAICGLREEKGFEELTERVESCSPAALRGNLLIGCLLDRDAPADAPDPAVRQATWLWRGAPFARESELTGFETTGLAGEQKALDGLEAELRLLTEGSPRFCGALAQRLNAWLEARRGSQTLSPAVRDLAQAWAEEAAEAGKKHPQELRMELPWPQEGGAARILLNECLGEGAAEWAYQPFSDRLTLMDGCLEDALGDVRYCRACLIPGTEEERQRMAVPPLSQVLARYLAENAEAGAPGRVTLAPEDLRFARVPGGFRAEITLRGTRVLTLGRLYGPEDLEIWAPEAIPTVAVWPSVPFAGKGWKAYYVYAHRESGVDVYALRHGQWETCALREAADGQKTRQWLILRTETYPACILLRRGAATLGVLMNILPPFLIQHAESAVVAVDFGTTGTTVMIRQGARVSPMQYACLQRTLLHGPYAVPLSDEFLPAVPILPILFSAEDMFGDDPDAWRQALVDGHAYIPVSFDAICGKEAGRLYYDLKWGTEEFRRKVNRMYLYQVMLTASLTAYLSGAPDVSWRIAMPGAMAQEGRAAYWSLMNELAAEVAADTGVPLTGGVPAVSYATESMAAGMYFRSRNEVNVRGGFLTLDVGGGSAELSLWLRGMNRPAASCSLPMGAQFMLLDSLLEHPEWLTEDFGGIPDPVIQKELRQLTGQFAVSRGSRRSLQKCRFMLDAFLGEHLSVLSGAMNAVYAQDRCTLTQALLLLNFSFLLMLAGQMQEQAFQDPLLNDLLPGYMEVCMAGRGCLLMMGLSDMLKARLKHFLRLPLSRNHPIREHLLVVSGAPKTEVAVGLLRLENLSSEAPAARAETEAKAPLPMQPLTLMKQYLTLLRAEFPAAATRLFPDLYAEGGENLLTRKAELSLQTILDNEFSQGHPVQLSYAACLQALKQTQGC